MRSLPSVVSALKAWHTFAIEVFGYDPERTLPPLSENDVCAWMPVFKHPGTAYNYVGSVKYVCVIEQLSFDWHGCLLSSVLKGNKKLYLSKLAGTLSQKCMLTELMMERVVMVADAMHRPDFAVFILMSWGFLCRVQSEAVQWQAGVYRDLITLSAERHSAIVFEGYSHNANCNSDRDILHCRWKRRKDRPEGSWLKRQCECKGREHPQLCLVHRAMDYINQTKPKPGDELFPEISGCSGPLPIAKDPEDVVGGNRRRIHLEVHQSRNGNSHGGSKHATARNLRSRRVA